MISNVIKQYEFLFRRIISLGICWLLSFYLLLALTASQNFTPYETGYVPPSIHSPDKNEVRDVYLVRYNPKNKFQPEYSIQIDALKIRNGKIGLFHSALCKQVNLQDLKLNLYSHTQNSRKAKNAPTDFSSSMENMIYSLPSNLRKAIYSDKSPSPADDFLENIGANITDFRLNWLHDNESQLQLQSKQAFLTAQNTGELMLRGAVTIRTPQRTLRSNHIVWDIRQQLFTVRGNCCLTQHNKKTFGRDICFDSRLNIQKKTIEHKQDGEALCIAKN